MQVNMRRSQRGRPLKAWIRALKEDLDFEITDGLWKNCIAWKVRIHEADPHNVRNEL